MNSLKNKSNVCAVIPFYNEEKTITTIIEQTKPFADFIFAVNDGSTDNSLKNIVQSDNVYIINLPKNCGKGFALNTGFEKAIEFGCESVATIDADLQHDPKFIPAMLQKLESFDIVVGNRLNELANMPLQRRLSNKITSKLLTIKTGQKILDSQCGFRAYNVDVIKNIKTTSNGYEAESEILIKAARAGFKIGFTEISTIYGNENSKMNPLKVTFSFIKTLFI